MNSDLQAIMARRRRMADAKKDQQQQYPPTTTEKKAADLEISVEDLGNDHARTQTNRSNFSHGSASTFDASNSEMKTDLQTIMERRRRLIEPEKQSISKEPPTSPVPDAVATPVRESLKHGKMSNDLQAIMERRRRLADSKRSPEENSAQLRRSSASVNSNDDTSMSSYASAKQDIDYYRASGDAPLQAFEEGGSSDEVDIPLTQAIGSVDEDDNDNDSRSKNPPASVPPPRSARREKVLEDDSYTDDDLPPGPSPSLSRKSRKKHDVRHSSSSSVEDQSSVDSEEMAAIFGNEKSSRQSSGRSSNRKNRISTPSSSRTSRRSSGHSKSDDSDDGGSMASSAKSGRQRSSKSGRRRNNSERDSGQHSKKNAKESIPWKDPAGTNTTAGDAGWGDFPAFAPAPAAADEAFPSSLPGAEEANFGGSSKDFADLNFDASITNADFGNKGSTQGLEGPVSPSSKPASASAFDASFGAFDATFAFPSEEAKQDLGFGSLDAFDPSLAFSSMPTSFKNEPQKTEWDSSPLVDFPTRTPGKLSLIHKSTFSGHFHSAPVSNPLNGNVIFCTLTEDGFFLHETDPRRNNIQVLSAGVFSVDLQRKVASKYNVSIHGIDSIITLTAGLHRLHGQTRVRVAAVMDLKVLETRQLMRCVALWQWGYGSPQPIALQYVMTPPSGVDYSYDPTTLQLADSVLFVAGLSPKGPCIFMCKPTVRESWSANFLSGGKKVVTMQVTSDIQRKYPYLAIALADCSISIWTYAAAISSGATKANEPAKRWLFPLCRLKSDHIFANIVATNFAGPGVTNQDTEETGVCTHLSWLPPQPSVSSLFMIAAAFQNGLAIFHVGLPVITDESKAGFHSLPEPSGGTQMLKTPVISPIVAKRWKGKHERSFVSWLNFGPHINPCLSILLHSYESEGSFARVVLGTIDFPVYRKGLMPRERLAPFRILSSALHTKNSGSFPTGLLCSSGLKSVLCYSSQKLLLMSPSTSSLLPDASVASLGFPIATDTPGLTSEGETLLVEGDSDKEGVLHVFTVTQCERQKSDSDASMLDWTRPTRRHWLCRTVVGDSKASGMEDVKEDKGGFGEVVSGGAVSDAIREVYDEALVNLLPCRLTRCHGANVCAVLFRPAIYSKIGSKEGASPDAVSIAFVDFASANAPIEVVEGRDIVFWPTEEGGSPRGLILSRDGSSLTLFKWQNGPMPKKCLLGKAFRPILGVDMDKDYVECRRVFSFSGASKLSLVMVGTRLRDSRSCILNGDLCAISDVSDSDWSSLLPNIVSGRRMWLEQHEEVFNVIGLEGDDSGYRNFALATSTRVMILSSALKSSAEIKLEVSNSALVPLGSFAVCFSSGSKVRYLCCLDGSLVSGVVATLPLPKNGFFQTLLLSVRPDRLLLYQWHAGTRLVERGQNPHIFLLPTAVTKPALMLEPMVANAICVGGKQPQSTPVLRTIIEKFGRKVASISHSEDEGIGSLGAGLSPQVFAMLQKYGLKDAASWLLTGITKFDRASNTKILPPWLPIASKSMGASNSDAFLHLIASGDEYFSDYVKSPDQNMAAPLPRPSDSSSYLSQEFARSLLRQGKGLDALKMLDLVGAESADSLILHLALVLEKDRSKDVTGILKAISGFDETGLSRSSAPVKPPSSLAALAVSLKVNTTNGANLEMSGSQVNRWIKPLAPSLQRSSKASRVRQRLFGENDLEKVGAKQDDAFDSVWISPCNESKHVWNEGPRKEKENLLMLDCLEDWLGRRRPVRLGKEGVSLARDRGEGALADILNMDDDSFGGKSDLESETDDWLEGIGEGRSDEANLSGYFRMSEGEDEDIAWRNDGLSDLSPYQNKAVLVGDAESFSLQPSTSGVDEGEPGKVKKPYDLVFNKSGHRHSSGLAIAATRGGSIDVGVLHSPDRQARQKCSIEFWFYLPSRESIADELVLARRTMGPSADDFSMVGMVANKESVLWELILRRSGELDFRSCAGSSLLSSSNYDDADDSDDEKADLAIFERWNHVCIVLSSKGQEGIANCKVSLYMKGTEVAADVVSMMPPGIDENDLDNAGKVDEIMQKSHLLFGLGHGAGFRMTEIRIWACERSADDTKSFLKWYLTAAEKKKKFQVKIKNKRGGGTTLGKGGFLPPPKSGGLAPPKGGLPLPKTMCMSLAPAPQKTSLSLAPSSQKEPEKFSLAPPPEAEELKLSERETDSGFDTSFGAFGVSEEKPIATPLQADGPGPPNPPAVIEADEEIEQTPSAESAAATLWDSALPLSQQIRSSAAAALIRGPPATRHFGGNRGGLPDYIGVERFGVGGIAICGSEKTIVWRDNEDPPALTYPIGASGAIVSDQMDDEGSEFLCCFLAKEKRMIVFELQSRTVVVELQMTTKLNFWRFLPPEAGENTLCFMLITPVGGFHWMPLEESPRPHQVWKRGPELQGKKVVSYEEGGSNGLEGAEILSRVGLVMVTKGSGGSSLEAWVVPISGDSRALQISSDVMGSCLCSPQYMDDRDGPFLPLLVTIHQLDEGIFANVLSVTDHSPGSLELGEVEVVQEIDASDFEDIEHEPPTMAMGTYPEAICCSLANIVVVIIRRKGLIAAFELEEGDLSLIAREDVGHYVIDAVMRYSVEVGGAEVVMLLSDNDNPKDGRLVSFCFRSAT